MPPVRVLSLLHLKLNVLESVLKCDKQSVCKPSTDVKLSALLYACINVNKHCFY